MADDLPDLDFGDELPGLDFGSDLPELDFGDATAPVAAKQFTPEQLAAEAERKRTGKRRTFDTAKPTAVKLPAGYSTPDDDLWLGEGYGVAKDATLGALGAFGSMIPFTPREANPAFGQGGTLATTANVLGGVGRGVATAVPASMTPAGPWGGAAALAADRAYQIQTEREGGIVESLRNHPYATSADVVSSGLSNLIPGGGAVKPLVANAANSLIQGTSEAIGEGAGGWDAVKAGARTALLGSILPLAHAGAKYRPELLPSNSDDAVDFMAVQRAEQEVEAEMTPAELHGYPLLPYRQRPGRELNYGDGANQALQQTLNPMLDAQNAARSADHYWALKARAERASGETHGIDPQTGPSPIDIDEPVPSRLEAIRSDYRAPYAPNFTLRKEANPNVVLESGAQGQARRAGKVAEPAGSQTPTGVGSEAIRSGPEQGLASGQTDAAERIKSAIVMDRKQDKPSLSDRGNSVLTSLFDQNRPFLMADRAAKEAGASLGPRQEAYKSFRGLQRRIVSKATDLAERGWIDDDTGRAVTPSLREVFKDVKPERMNDLAAFLVARRAPEMAAKQETLPFDLKDADATVKALEPEFKAVADKYDSVMAGALEFAAKKGFFSPEQAKAIRDENKFYTPWERVDDDGKIVLSSHGGKAKVTKKGSARNIANPIEASVNNLTRLISAVERNESKRIFADLADIPGMEQWVKPVNGTARDFAIKDGSVMEIRRNGESRAYKVHPEVAKTLNAISAEESKALSTVLKFQADLQRAGVVFDPAFAANNLLRDAWQQAAVSRTTSIPFANQARGLKALATKKGRETAGEWSRGAGNQAIEYGAIFKPEEAIKSLGKGDADRNALMRAIRNPLESFKKVLTAAESVGRIGEYDRAKKQAIKRGMSELDAKAEAEFQSSDLLDFGMSGRSATIKALRRYVPFFGANMSGMYREGAVMRSPVKLAKAIGVLGGMEALNYAINQNDKEYWNEPNWKRFAFWRIPTKQLFGWDHNVWLPKPPGLLNYGITAPIKTGLESLHQKDPLAAKKNAAEVVRSTAINVLPPAYRTVTELSRGEHGFSDFMGREIVPQKLQGLPKRMQYTGQTTELAKAASRGAEKLGFELSPIKADYFVQGVAGPLMKRGTELLDPLFGEQDVGGYFGAVQRFGKDTIRRNIAQPGSFGSEVQNRFFEKMAVLEQEAKARKAGEKSKADTSRLKAMQKANEQAQSLRALAGKTDDENRRLAIMRRIDALYAPFVEMPLNY